MMNRMIAALTAILLLAIMACRPLPTHTPTSSTISMPPPTGQADPNTTPEPEHRIYLPSVLKGYTPHLEISCLNGPVQNYVNDDIVLEVTYGGKPVEGAIVHFAGFEKHTGKDGKVVFNIDMAGPFKARVEKPGYKDASTLLWVFPKGNDKFPIRAIRLHSEQVGTTISDYRMAGANCASIKVYYLYDEGNIYPASPFPSGWTRIPRDVHQKFYEWQISEARHWGFEKIYLIFQPLPESIFASEEPHPTVFTEEAERNHFEQKQKEALWLAEFAEEQGVDILDAFTIERSEMRGLETPPEEFLIYRELLPRLREKFSGELAVMMPLGIQNFVSGQKPPEYDHSEFNIIAPVFSCRHANLNTDSPSGWEDAMQKYLEHAKQLGEKYGAKVMPVWLAGLEVHDEELLNQFLTNGKFEDYEDVKVWLLNSILEESSKRNVDGVEACALWYHSRRADPHGPYGYKFPIWQSKRPLDTVTKHFSNPWNKEGRETLRVLQHAVLATNFAASYNQEFAEWAEDRVGEALRAYEISDYDSARSIAYEILGKVAPLDNPLGIVVDGDGSEWQGLDPVYFNPSRILPWSSLTPWFNPETQPEGFFKAKDMRNLKCVYVVNDSENLYLMLEFYEQVPTLFMPTIDIDISGEWDHQEGKEFHVILNNPILNTSVPTLWSSKYKGAEWSCRNPYDPSSHMLSELKNFGYGKVIELEIPLELIGNPEEVNLIVYYPWMAQWGGMEANIVKWYENTR